MIIFREMNTKIWEYKMIRIIILIFLFIIIIPMTLFAQGGKDYGMFAPKDAYLDTMKFHYYGSENEWSRRMFTHERAEKFYKRRGQRELLMILDGNPVEAENECRYFIQKYPDDLESRFILTIALTQQGKINDAFMEMTKAIEHGLPFAQFLAGPRELLMPLTDSQVFKKYYSDHPIELIHGPLLGGVTENSARFWIRTVNEVSVTINIYSDTNTTQIIR